MVNIKLAVFLHATALAFLSFVLWYEVQYVHFHGEGILEYNGFGGKLKYLTFLSLVSFSN